MPLASVSAPATAAAASVTPSATTTGPSAAADQVSSTASAGATQAAFQIPGKKISVLPIGLGIFAGISVIALIVVGLVTYERTKYRRVRGLRVLPRA
ncbi:hypothetical protein BV25DRAFT_1824165 [Artomyces pyxidatus]|uniref:Uncharacterized protein n=1 Tax=Artomyces pyxidatus TaxID=48021 RepID=A0ACB8T4B6_9AGAM|nr:hypothetical protein BV25DRAFT_1824165 [Artomyces pyxidatus]